MPKWTDYTIKTNPADNDEVMVLDTAGKANKRLGLSVLSDWIIGKIANKVFENLQTNNKTVLGAINELDSKRLCMQQIYTNGTWDDCNNIPTGETAMAFDSAKNKPPGNTTWFIFCMGSAKDKVKYQLAISYTTPFSVKARMYDSTNDNWLDWK